MELSYTFEPMSNGMYQVRLNGCFVCYSTHTDENKIDDFLRIEGYKNREEFFEDCLDVFDENY